MSVPVRTALALALVFALLLRATPAAAATPDVSEARRRFVAAVHSSDRAVVLAEAALDFAISEAARLSTGDTQRSRDAMARTLKALKDFETEKQRILATDLGTWAALLSAAARYARACDILGAVVRVEVAVIVSIVAIVATTATGGAAFAVVAAVVVAVAAVLSLVVTVEQSLPEILRALGFREAGDTTEKWMKDNPWFGTGVAAAGVVAAVISTAAAALSDLRAAEAAARAAQTEAREAQDRARTAAASTSQAVGETVRRFDAAVPAPAERIAAGAKEAVGQVLTSFEGDLGGSFHVTLESGQATKTALAASLRGTAAIASRANPALKLSVDGDVSLTAGGGGWASLRGRGTARLSGFGPVLTIPNATVESQNSVLALRGDTVPVRGCSQTVENGSLFAPPRATFAGTLRCGSWAMSSSTLTLDGSAISGGGTLTAWSKSFSMSYSASGAGLSARGSLSGPDTPWTRLSGIDAEYQIEAPKLDLKLDGEALAATFGARKVNVRTIARKKDGSPWSSASATPSVVMVPAPPSPGIPVPFPNLPAPQDVEKAARDACEGIARRTLVGQALQHALDVCRSDHPSPPGVPALPGTVTLKVGDVFR